MRKRERGMDPRPWIRSYVPARHRSKRKRKVNIHLRFMATCESYEVFRGGCQRYFTLVDTQSSSVLRYLLYWWIDSQRFVLKGRGSCGGLDAPWGTAGEVGDYGENILFSRRILPKTKHSSQLDELFERWSQSGSRSIVILIFLSRNFRINLCRVRVIVGIDTLHMHVNENR